MLGGFGELGLRFEPRAYAEACVADLLLGPPATHGAVIGDAALLLSCVGGAAAADRLCERWLAVTELPATDLLRDDAAARGFAQLHVARQAVPTWTRGLPPLDVEAVAHAHRRWLGRADSPIAPDFGSSAAARAAEGFVWQATAEPDPLKRLAARADDAADTAEVHRLLAEWVAKAGPRPTVAQLAGCGRLAPLLIDGALAEPLGVPDGWPEEVAGELLAALRLRDPAPAEDVPMAELVDRVLAARHADPDEPPPARQPAATPGAIAAAERRIGRRLPDDYRAFLAASDGLPADVVLPRLLRADELHAAGNGVVVISERTEYGVVTLVPSHDWLVVEADPGLGSTTHPSFRALLDAHLALLGGSHAGADPGSAWR